MAERQPSDAESRGADRQALRLAAFSLPLWGLMILRSASESLELAGDAGTVISLLLQFGIPLFVGLASLLYLIRAIVHGFAKGTTAILVVAIASHGLLAALCWLPMLMPA